MKAGLKAIQIKPCRLTITISIWRDEIMKNIVIYSINNCGYCEAAKSLCRSLNLDFKEINLSGDDAGKQELIAKTSHRTMPQIFIDDQFIGGYAELKQFLKK